MSKSKFRASVTYAPFTSEVREFFHPDVERDSGILRVEAAGVCGSDIAAHAQNVPDRILGHENVGEIHGLGDLASAKWGLKPGDRVVVEEYLPCGHCNLCRTTQFRFCKETDSRGGGIRYGTTGIGVSPGLWGGYSQFMYLHPRSVLHKAPPKVPAHLLTLSLPIGNGYEWSYVEGGAGPGKTVVVYGPGQQGLACVYAAKASGARTVILLGLSEDEHRLDVARHLGADYAVSIEDIDPVEFVREVTGSEMADLVIDSAVGNGKTFNDGVAMLKQSGVLLLATALDYVSDIALRAAQWKCVNIKGVRGHSFAAVEWAIERIANDGDVLNNMCTQSFSLSEVDRAIRATAGQTEDKTVHVSVLPWSD